MKLMEHRAKIKEYQIMRDSIEINSTEEVSPIQQTETNSDSNFSKDEGGDDDDEPAPPLTAACDSRSFYPVPNKSILQIFLSLEIITTYCVAILLSLPIPMFLHSIVLFILLCLFSNYLPILGECFSRYSELKHLIPFYPKKNKHIT